MKNLAAHVASARKAIAAAAAVVAYLLANGLLSPERAHAASVYIGAVALILVYAVPNGPLPVKGAPVYVAPPVDAVPAYVAPVVAEPVAPAAHDAAPAPVSPAAGPVEPVPTAPPVPPAA